MGKSRKTKLETEHSTLATRLAEVETRIAHACRQAGRPRDSVRLIAVSKGQEASLIEEAYNLGLRHFGENYVQEWQDKNSLLNLPELNWHLIGHLQSNKAKFLSNGVYSIDSIDRQSVAEVLERNRMVSQVHSARLRVLIQLTVDESDSNKSGISYLEAPQLCKFLAPLLHLNWSGFMGIGPAGKTDDELTNLYSRFSEVANELWKKYAPVPDLPPEISLGMSNDLDVAIACGSTEVRIGTALFGSRPPKLQKTGSE